MEGRPLETYEIIVNLIANTTTKEGLKVTDEEFKDLNLFTKDWHGQWNYFLKSKS